jgi:biopolymer transport protein ExbD
VLNRPSARRKSGHEGIELNLVPILDTMVTLIGFLLFTTSFLAIVSIESPLPTASTEEVQQQLKEKPLQLTVTLRAADIQVWSPFQKITTKVIPNVTGGIDLKSLHETMLEVKKQFPAENKVVLVPTATTAYEQLVTVMDSVRTIEPTDAPIYLKNEKTGVDEQLKTLFPQVVFGNLLGET